jgi:hypothetical protein
MNDIHFIYQIPSTCYTTVTIVEKGNEIFQNNARIITPSVLLCMSTEEQNLKMFPVATGFFQDYKTTDASKFSFFVLSRFWQSDFIRFMNITSAAFARDGKAELMSFFEGFRCIVFRTTFYKHIVDILTEFRKEKKNGAQTADIVICVSYRPATPRLHTAILEVSRNSSLHSVRFDTEESPQAGRTSRRISGKASEQMHIDNLALKLDTTEGAAIVPYSDVIDRCVNIYGQWWISFKPMVLLLVFELLSVFTVGKFKFQKEPVLNRHPRFQLNVFLHVFFAQCSYCIFQSVLFLTITSFAMALGPRCDSIALNFKCAPSVLLCVSVMSIIWFKGLHQDQSTPYLCWLKCKSMHKWMLHPLCSSILLAMLPNVNSQHTSESCVVTLNGAVRCWWFQSTAMGVVGLDRGVASIALGSVRSLMMHLCFVCMSRPCST